MELLTSSPAIPAAAPAVDQAIIAAAAADQRPADAPADAPADRPAAVTAVIDWNAEAGEFIEFAHELYSPLWPSLEKVYTPTVRARIAKRAAPVMQKYDFNLARLMGKYGDEIMLAGVLVPLVPSTLAAIRYDRAVREAQEKGITINANQQNAAAIAQPTATPTAAPIAAAKAAAEGAADGASPINKFGHGFPET